MSGVRLLTVKNWSKEVDCLSEWLCYDGQSGNVTCVYCELCSKHADKLKYLCNFSPSFVNGITGSPLKKTTLSSIQNRTHTRSVNMSKKPKMIDEIFGTTPIGKPLVCSSLLSANHYSATVTQVYY